MEGYFLAALIIIKSLEWIIYPELSIQDQWTFLLMSKYLIISVLFSFTSILINKRKLLFRSVIAFICIDSWINLIKYILYQLDILTFDPSVLLFVFFTSWLIWILYRDYEIVNDDINKENVIILLLKPRSFFDITKGFIGLPISSICLLVENKIYAFSTKTETFIKRDFCEKWSKTHWIFDTGIKSSDKIKESIQNILGSKRGIGVKCVWQIRDVLKLLGEDYEIKNPLAYIPGIVALKLRSIKLKRRDTYDNSC